MKKTYETPTVEVVEFKYRDQVVVASGSHVCITQWTNNPGGAGCVGTTTSNSEHI